MDVIYNSDAFNKISFHKQMVLIHYDQAADYRVHVHLYGIVQNKWIQMLYFRLKNGEDMGRTCAGPICKFSVRT